MGSHSFAYTGGWQTFTVPAKVKLLTVTLNGAGSGSRHGGQVTGKMVVSPGQKLYVVVGQQGHAHSGANGGGGGWGGGGDGGAGTGGTGGDGGGGATYIRVGGTTGTIRCVAAGAGGDSGDTGRGGGGGAATGEAGGNGTTGQIPASDPTAWYIETGVATGGTGIQGGKGGNTAASTGYDGHDGVDSHVGAAGAGGHSSSPCHGGGGGGGGYLPGGGGQAAVIASTPQQSSPGGGGGGGSNYLGNLSQYTNVQAGAGTGNGSVSLSWVTPPPADPPPTPPTEVKINNVAISDEMATYATSQVTVSAKIDDPGAKTQEVRLVVWKATASNMVGHTTHYGTYGKQAHRDSVTLTGLSKNTRYYLRLYTQDKSGKFSTNHTSANFWTNRPPTAPTTVNPAPNTQYQNQQNIAFTWTMNDPDPNTPQAAFQLQYRVAGTPTEPVSDTWLGDTGKKATNITQWVYAPPTFKTNVWYEWQVRTWDPQGSVSPYSVSSRFYITGPTTAPLPQYPVGNIAVQTDSAVTFAWKFRDVTVGATQVKANLRYRVKGAANWATMFGDTTTPGGVQSWTLPTDAFQEGLNYEWQVQTQNSVPLTSDWSDSAYFWAVPTPGDAITVIEPSVDTQSAPPLGSGNNRVFIYDRGGTKPRGEITPLVQLEWSRKRDDISNCLFTTNGFTADCGQLLGSLRSWMHEVVIFRDGVRVFEGPITRITYTTTDVEVEAKDVMAYLYRRIMRQGYNDAYRQVNAQRVGTDLVGEQLGQKTVVQRAATIIMNALCYDDPNVLPYLTSINYSDDAKTSRVVDDFSRTAWEEVDDLAATAGLDYVTVGRRIVLWDTHRSLGRLPEMRDGDFSDPPVVTEYGMQTANFFAVTSTSGIHGEARKGIDILAGVEVPEFVGDDGLIHPWGGGFLEQLASAYGEQQGDDAVALTSEAQTALQTDLNRQAERNIGHRWPTPLVVRVPDNSTLNPELTINIQQLVPGVWIPLRATGTVRTVAQWQKLDSVTVSQDASGEKISVVMSPAPNGGDDDPDLDSGSDL
jgi:hypothetical protein